MHTILRLLIMFLALHGAAWAQSDPPGRLTPEQRRAEIQASWQAASRTATHGPATVPLLDQATLRIPKPMVFIPKEEAARLSRALGNRPGPDLVGIVTTFDDADDWIVLIRWTAEGYVRDDEAKDLKADDVLANLREGTAEGNKDRVARGFPSLELTGWTQPPAYDQSTHRLAWALGVKNEGEADDSGSINFNTRALGREGYFSLNLVTARENIAANRQVSATLLSNLDYVDGKRYADFNASTDRVAEYGLAALIGVVAAKKLGLLALAGVFLAKFAKIGLLAVVGLGVAFRKLFKRNPPA